MEPSSKWDELRGWVAHLPLRFAFRIVWLCARLNLGGARAVYAAMWDANLDLPPLEAGEAQHG